MNPLRMYLTIVTPILFINLLRRRYGPLVIVDFLFLFYLFWITISLAVNNPNMVVENAGVTSIEFFGGYLVARASIRNRASFGGLCQWLGIMIALTIIPALWEVFTGTAIVMALIDTIPGVQSVGDGYFTRINLQRVQVIFQHPILYGLVCSTGISLVFVSLKGELSESHRLILTIILSLCTFLSLSSGALLAMVLQFFMITWYWALKRFESRWLILLIVIVLAYIAIDFLSTRTPIRVFLTYATFSAHTAYFRLYIFEWGMVNVWNNPMLGLGFKEWVRPSWMGSSVDNFWLLTTMRYGIPCFLSIAGAYLILIWRVGRQNFAADVKMLQYRRGWLFTLVGLCFTLTTVHVWSGPYSFLAFLLGAGVWFLDAIPNTSPSFASQEEDAPTRSDGVIYARAWPSDKTSEVEDKDLRYTRMQNSSGTSRHRRKIN